MIELRGKYNTANVYTDNVEETAVGQIIDLCNQEFTKDSKIRIMPDTHAGAGCTIGTTMTIVDKVVPNLVGVDIGCGMECLKLKDKHIEFGKLDKIIRKFVPLGFSVRDKNHAYVKNIAVKDLICIKHVNLERAEKSVGTLGGGNHFIEVDKDTEGNLYLVIHTGSRNLGKQVAEHYQKIAISKLPNTAKIKEDLIKKLQSEGRSSEINEELKKVKQPVTNPQLAYLEGEDFKNYLHDMKITQEFATWNRKAIADTIIREMGFKVVDEFTTIHNYIDTDEMILRKGAISASLGEKVIIPINMEVGSIIAIGKGNEDWNCSAPHGAGRLMSRSQAKSEVKMENYKESMKDVWTTSVNSSTIDEAPEVYKPVEEIIENVQGTVEIVEVIKSVYNIKSSEDNKIHGKKKEKQK